MAIAKTKEGEEIGYSNGKKFEKLLSSYDGFFALARREGVT